LKALKCLSCQTFVVVSDAAIGVCGKCKIPLQEDKFLNRDLKLTKDEPIKRKYYKSKKSKTKKRKHKK
jgi:hypothetical protein